ncbi:MAG: class I SAM-dependent methyltransferase, partial [Patescibacteria group bacterium]
MKKIIFQKNFNKDYYFGKVYEDYNSFLDFNKLAKDLIKRYNFSSFLDIGCGCGNLAKAVKINLEKKKKKKCDVQGIDFSDFAVRKARAPFITRADCCDLSCFSDNRFDFVYILTTFSYPKTIKDLKRAMREAFRVSKKIIVFEDVYKVPPKFDRKNSLKLHEDYDPYRRRVLNKSQWKDLWRKALAGNL